MSSISNTARRTTARTATTSLLSDKHGGYDPAPTATSTAATTPALTATSTAATSTARRSITATTITVTATSTAATTATITHNHTTPPSPRRLRWRPWRRIQRRLRRRFRALRQLDSHGGGDAGECWDLLVTSGPTEPLLPATFSSQRPRSLRAYFFSWRRQTNPHSSFWFCYPDRSSSTPKLSASLRLIAYSPDFSLSLEPVTYGTAATPCS